MRITYVIQRYGRDVVGGGESFCRQFASRLAARGHDVTVVTSRVADIIAMVDEYPAGTEEIDGVTVHRLSSPGPIDGQIRATITRLAYGNPKGPAEIHYAWQRAMGPLLPTLGDWLESNRRSIDVLVPVTQFYFPANEAILTAERLRLPTFFHPLAHEDPSLAMAFFDRIFAAVSGFGFLTEEEERLVRDRFGCRQPGLVHGVGVDLDPPVDDAAADALTLPTRPFLCYVGRPEKHKLGDAIEFLARFRKRHGHRVDLVAVGPTTPWLESQRDVRRMGFLPDAVRNALLQRSLALVMPSPFESFSMVLTEAWALGRPALVNGRCGPLRGQATRSGGAFAYDGYEDFEAGLLRLLDEPGTGDRLGAAGRAYVEDRYRWDDVIDDYEDALGRIAGRAVGGRGRTRPNRADGPATGSPGTPVAPVPPVTTVPTEATAPVAAVGSAPSGEPAPGPVAVLVVADGDPVDLLDVLEQLEGRTLDGAAFHVLVDAGRADERTVEVLGRLGDVSIAATPDDPCRADELAAVLRTHGYRYLVRLAGPVRLPPGWWSVLGAAVGSGPAGLDDVGGRVEAIEVERLDAAGSALLDDAWATLTFAAIPSGVAPR